MDNAEKLLKNWGQSPPRDGVDCKDALAVLAHLGMTVERNNQGHYQAFHRKLVGSDSFPYGSFTVNCHAYGVQGNVHPRAIKDILRAAKLLLAPAEQDDER